ncbi:hypothetical protein CDD80_5187 [Ophiocordyceps camponoti-rufipedis]|uniref:Uncharacterized protein n=1 Tax=Ophiocordyceps camponoti-rufipedis TaxID=2004952 RepID=A0A2C5ZIW8_9HYPO|nr:hypothetical protein CDD80_5187 [Ophiocordyceps camponoti-rufipedis]
MGMGGSDMSGSSPMPTMPQTAADPDYSNDMETPLDDKRDPGTASKLPADSNWGEEDDEDESDEITDEGSSDEMEASSYKAKHDNSKDMKEKSQRHAQRPSSATSLDDLEDPDLEVGEDASSLGSSNTSRDGKGSEPAPKKKSSSATLEDDLEMEEISTDLEQSSTPVATSGHSATSRTSAESLGHVKGLEVSDSTEESKHVKDEPKALKKHLTNASAASNASGSTETMKKTAHRLVTRSTEVVADSEKLQDEGESLESNQGGNTTIPTTASETTATLTPADGSNSTVSSEDADMKQDASSSCGEGRSDEYELVTQEDEQEDEADASPGLAENLTSSVTQNSTAPKPRPQSLQKREKLECGPAYCQRRGWYQRRSAFLASESDTYEWMLMTRRIVNWSSLVVETCRWDGKPPNCGFAEEMEGDVKFGWTLVIGDRVHWKEICDRHFSSYFNGKDCCDKYEYTNPCRRGYRRLWCLSKVRGMIVVNAELKLTEELQNPFDKESW